MEVGDFPRDLGLIDLAPVEMMFWMYLPISLPGDHTFHLPDNLRQFIPLIREARWDDHERFVDRYVYLTAKTLWVEGDYIGNRPGWHCDGFGTDDINYIWSDRAPTEFYGGCFRVSDDCEESMIEMDVYGRQAEATGTIRTYPDKHLLRLNPAVVHRSPAKFEPGMRTFVKLSLSEDRYDLVGNSINHAFGPLGPMVERQANRNHPASTQ